MANIDLKKEEREYLRKLITQKRKALIKEEKTIIGDTKPAFIKGEIAYDEFLKTIIKKLR